jgi:beta-lactamase regulating signal transducer with metallopeptidase domain
LFPAFSFPLYQLINPDRNSISFRLGSLFDINRWLNMDLWGIMPIGLIFIIILFITIVIFLFQEMIPVLRHTLETKEADIEMRIPDKNSIVSQAIEQLPVDNTDIFILDDDDHILHSTTGRNASIFLSEGLITELNKEQIQAAIAHELAHINRNKKPLLIIIFLFRVLMFFNPVVLLEFRRIIQDEEKICDDIAVSLTGKPHALSETLQKLYYKVEDEQPFQFKKLSSMKDSLEEYSHNIHIESRIIRLEHGQANKTGWEWIKFALVLIVIMAINYFVV